MSGVLYVIEQLGVALDQASQRIADLHAQVAALQEELARRPPADPSPRTDIQSEETAR